MTIDQKLIAYLEELSRLDLSQDEREDAGANLSKILAYIDKLGELGTDGVEALSHPFSFTNRFREDEAVQSTSRERMLQNAPRQKDGCFQVPKTVE